MNHNWIWIEAYDSARTRKHADEYFKKLERRLAAWRREVKAGGAKVKAFKKDR
jgi:hypothetical protein